MSNDLTSFMRSLIRNSFTNDEIKAIYVGTYVKIALTLTPTNVYLSNNQNCQIFIKYNS